MSRLYALFIFTIICAACSKDKDVIVAYRYFPSGAISDEIELDRDSIPNGTWKQFFENGKLEQEFIYVNGTQNGPGKIYYPSGNLESEGYFYDNFRVGPATFYFDTPEKKISAKVEYVIVGNKYFENSVVEYDKSGKVVSSSPQVSLSQKNDSLIVKIDKPEFDSMRVLIGGFDSVYFVEDSTSLEIVDGRNFKTSIPLKGQYKTGDVIRGMVQNYATVGKSKTKGLLQKIRPYYFTHKVQ